jgi:hypothetical protein
MVGCRRFHGHLFVGSIRDGVMNGLAKKDEDKKPCNAFHPTPTKGGLFRRDCVLKVVAGVPHEGDHLLPDGTLFRDGVVK